MMSDAAPQPAPEPAPQPAPAPAPQPPVPQPAPTPPQQPDPNVRPSDLRRSSDPDVIAAVNALPEKIVNALRESMPKQPATQAQQTQQTQTEKSARRSFAQWWFGA